MNAPAATPALQLGESFRCEHYRCALRHLVCLQRQRATEKVRNTGKSRVPMAYQFCASGACAQGAEIAQRFEGVDVAAPVIKTMAIPPTPPRPAELPHPPTKETPMASCTGCNKPLSAKNTLGVCMGCRHKDRVHGTCSAEGCTATLRKDSPNAKDGRCSKHPLRGAAPALPRVTLAVPRPAPQAPAGLPPVTALPLEYLAACVAEVRRRGDEIDRLRAELHGFSAR